MTPRLMPTHGKNVRMEPGAPAFHAPPPQAVATPPPQAVAAPPPAAVPAEPEAVEEADDVPPPSANDGRRLSDVAREAALSAERTVIADTLRQVHWNRRKAAQ